MGRLCAISILVIGRAAIVHGFDFCLIIDGIRGANSDKVSSCEQS